VTRVRTLTGGLQANDNPDTSIAITSASPSPAT